MNPVFLFGEKMTPLRKLLLMKAVSGGVPLNEYTATGNPLTFNTNVSKPLKSLSIPWTPSQSGSGDPSPENVRPISGQGGVTVYHSGADTSNPNTISVTFPALGKNKAKFWQTGYISTQGTVVLDTHNALCEKIFLKNGQTVAISATAQSIGYAVFSDAELTNMTSRKGAYATTYTATEDCYFVCWFVLPSGVTASQAAMDDNECQIEFGSATSYEPYTNTCYGGELDLVSGVLTVEWNGETYDGSEDENWNVEFGDNFYIMTPSTFPRNTTESTMICNYAKSVGNVPSAGSCKITSSGNFNIKIGTLIDVSTVEGFRAWLATNNVQVIVKLSSPQTIQLIPTEITALLGDNVIWSDTNGQNTAVYYKRG